MQGWSGYHKHSSFAFPFGFKLFNTNSIFSFLVNIVFIAIV